MTQDSIADLMSSYPVYGFVFLCRYAGEDQEDTEPAPQDLWFANQVCYTRCHQIAESSCLQTTSPFPHFIYSLLN